jgi:hypothetical protein
VPIKLQRGHQLKLKKKRRRRRKKNREKRIERELQILEKINNALVAISLESTVRSCWILDMLFLLHSSTDLLERLEGKLSV